MTTEIGREKRREAKRKDKKEVRDKESDWKN